MPLRDIETRIEEATARAGRDAGAVTLIAVSKVQPLDRVRRVLDEGHRIFGENRVQEAAGKWPDLRAATDASDPITLHMIGPLQTNKLASALGLFDAIHTLDRDTLARKLADSVQNRGACPSLFVQVNTGAEAQKSGLLPEDLDVFVETCRTSYDLPLEGLMAIPPIDQDPDPHFAILFDMAERNGLKGLSMGMSNDFEAAIARGATHVRIGSAIFGNRISDKA